MKWVKFAFILSLLLASALGVYLASAKCPDATQFTVRNQWSTTFEPQTLRAGASKTAIQLPQFVKMAGHGFWAPRAEVKTPIFTRAAVIASGTSTVGIVSSEVMLIPETVKEEVEKRVGFRILYTATHTHNSFGGFDNRLSAQFVGMGRYETFLFEALVKSAVESLLKAKSSLTAVQLQFQEGDCAGFSRARTGTLHDSQSIRISARAPDGKTLFEFQTISGHPTYYRLDPNHISGDVASAFAEAREHDAQTISFIAQSAAGNAMLMVPDSEKLDVFATRWAQTCLKEIQPVPIATKIFLHRVEMNLPSIDLTRIVPSSLLWPATKALCRDSREKSSFDVLQFENHRIAFLPFEVTGDFAQKLPSVRFVTLSNGYGGYLDTEENVKNIQGESKRQYFSSQLGNFFFEALRK